ncbi:hypothetical protein ACIA5C_19830 [Actinoplanes sp. NPDC051343]|uniref:hypothetical protein n=1 Tax=Actinoplanes sp. NPDC051343 TaxID=3363906 RepID=UPI0037BDE2B8
MLRSNRSAEDAVANHTRQSEQADRREAAKTADSARIRASHAAGRDSRSIGTTRTAYGR